MVRRGLLRCEYQYPHSTITKICKDISRAARDRNRAKNKATHVQGSLLLRSHSALHRGSLLSSHAPPPIPLSIPIPGLLLAPVLIQPLLPSLPHLLHLYPDSLGKSRRAQKRLFPSLLLLYYTKDSYFNNKF